MAAYKGTTVPASPTCSMIVGPNTGLGHSSMVFIIESQIAYIRDALRRCGERGFAAVEPRAEAQGAWNADVQRRMKRTVWNTGGCASWYLDAHGRNTTLWPRTTFTFRRLLARVRRRRVRRRRRTPRTRPREVTHEPPREDPRRQGRRDHRRRLRHRPRAGAERRPAGRAARALRLDEAGLAETVDLVKAAGAREVRSDVVDVSDRAAVAAYAAAVVEQFGRVNMVVNNAGVALTGDFEEIELRGLRLDRRRQLLGRRQRHQGVPAPPDRLRRRPPRQHLQPVRADQHARPDGVQRHEVRRPRLHRGAARGDADHRPPGRRHLRPPRRHQDRHRPQRPQDRRARTQAAIDALFEKKLARMTPEKAAQIIIDGVLGREGARAGRPRRPRAAPLRQARRLPLPGRRRPRHRPDHAVQALTRRRLTTGRRRRAGRTAG